MSVVFTSAPQLCHAEDKDARAHLLIADGRFGERIFINIAHMCVCVCIYIYIEFAEMKPLFSPHSPPVRPESLACRADKKLASTNARHIRTSQVICKLNFGEAPTMQILLCGGRGALDMVCSK